jgi:type I restriction enzyme M protein
MSQNHNQIEARLWSAADELRANSKLKSSEYSVPVLGLIFLRYADQKFSAAEEQLAGKSTGRRRIGPADYQALGVLYLQEKLVFDWRKRQQLIPPLKDGFDASGFNIIQQGFLG